MLLGVYKDVRCFRETCIDALCISKRHKVGSSCLDSVHEVHLVRGNVGEIVKTDCAPGQGKQKALILLARHRDRQTRSSYSSSATINPFLRTRRGTPVILLFMQKWEYQVYASHLDPAELVIILNDSGREGWELVTLAPVTDYYPPELIEPTATVPGLDAGEAEEVIPVAAFRYIFKRPLK